MFLLGLMGWLQIAFLPGYLVVRGLKLAQSWLSAIALSFALSLLLNHLLVLGLVTLHLYCSPVIHTVFAVECLALLGMFGRGLLAPLALPGPRRLAAIAWAKLGPAPHRTRLQSLALTAVVVLVVGYAVREIASFGQIFTAWDAVASWNFWAAQWSEGHVARHTAEYPQLLPCNLSLSYVFLQTSAIGYFAKGVMFLFPLLLLLAMLGLYEESDEFAWVLATACTFGLLYALLGLNNLTSGYADAPVAFFAFMPVAELVRAARSPNADQRNMHLWLGAALAAGAALTKQMALLVAAVYPVLAWLMVLWPGVQRGNLRRDRALMMVVGLAVLVAAIAGPWWIYKVWQIRSGLDHSTLKFQAFTIQQSRSLLQRPVFAWRLIIDKMPWPLAVAGLAAVVLALWNRLCRWPLLLVALPYAAAWTFAFAYDPRNLAMITGLLGMGVGFGLVELVRRRASLPRLRAYHALAGLILAAVGLNALLPSDLLVARQNRLQRAIGFPLLNQRLYNYAAAPGWSGKILTEYWFVRWLPGLEDLGRWPPPDTPLSEVLQRELPAPDIGHLLVNRVLLNFNPAAAAYLEGEKRAGRLRLEFQEHDFDFYTKVRPAAANPPAARTEAAGK